MWLIGAILLAADSPAGLSQSAKPQAEGIVQRPAYLSDDDLLLFSVQLDQLSLTETLNAHGDQQDPLLPVGELARLLDLDVDVSAADGRVTGTLGEARRPLLIDLNQNLIRSNGRQLAFTKDDVGRSPTDIYLRASLLEQILPVKFEVDGEALAIVLKPREKLPIEARMERIARSRTGGSSVDSNDTKLLRIRSPYQLISPPSFDVALEGGRDPQTSGTYSGRYDVRVAGDLLYTNFQGYVGSDNDGRPNTARVLLERRSNSGALPLGLTRVSAGDVFTPALAIGARSVGGRGVSFTTASLEQASVFDTIDLRGELPLGYDVELYVNDVLRGSQESPVQGRYEFLKVPLVRGQNVIRIVTYGPRGEREQVTRVINVGGGQIQKHRTQFDFALVDQGEDLVSLRAHGGDAASSIPQGLRAVSNLVYGLTENLTIIGGAAIFPDFDNSTRGLLTGGIRTSLLGLALQADGALENGAAVGATFGLAGQIFGASTIIQHSEYRGGFVDETTSAFSSSQQIRRHTSLNLDFSLPEIARKRLPLSVRGLRDEFTDGGTSYVASARTSMTMLGALLSTGLDFQRSKFVNQPATTELLGNFSAAKFVDFKWQLRGAANYRLVPTTMLRDLSMTADRALSNSVSLRLGAGKSFGVTNDTYGQAGATFRLPIGELAVSGDYALASHDLKLGVRLAFGSIFNPNSRRYMLTPPGVASGGSAVFRAFIDQDGDGRFGQGDQPLGKVSVEGGPRPTVTSASGTAVATGLGSGPTTALRIDTKEIDEVGVSDGPPSVEFAPRPGKVVAIDYPLQPVAEVYARFVTPSDHGASIGISALHVRLVSAKGDHVIDATTEFDGSVVFSEVRPGAYQLELDPEQANRLGMALETPQKLIVKAGAESETTLTVVFNRPNSRLDHEDPKANESD